MVLGRNKPCKAGRAIGKELARLYQLAVAELKPKFGADFPHPCKSCAFRAGTFPNGCLETVTDALKCTMEGKMFYCHQDIPQNGGKAKTPCAGYMISRASLYGKEPIETPWKFSHEYAEEQQP